jgi:hypothetical protein
MQNEKVKMQNETAEDAEDAVKEVGFQESHDRGSTLRAKGQKLRANDQRRTTS